MFSPTFSALQEFVRKPRNLSSPPKERRRKKKRHRGTERKENKEETAPLTLNHVLPTCCRQLGKALPTYWQKQYKSNVAAGNAGRARQQGKKRQVPPSLFPQFISVSGTDGLFLHLT